MVCQVEDPQPDPEFAAGSQLAQLKIAVQPQVGAVYSLADAREALTAKSSGGIPGRVVLQP